MDSIAYQKILFRTAMCVMACDGDIHHSEVREMEVAFEKTDFFKDLVFKTEIDFVLDRFKSSEKEFLIECVDNLSKATMSPVQELQILELALRIIYADNRVDKNEIDFLKIIKGCLSVPDEIFYSRFGDVPFLDFKGYRYDKSEDSMRLLDNIVLPDVDSMTLLFDEAGG
jgi:uncharacterized tellurite resistance protein B-like protein